MFFKALGAVCLFAMLAIGIAAFFLYQPQPSEDIISNFHQEPKKNLFPKGHQIEGLQYYGDGYVYQKWDMENLVEEVEQGNPKAQFLLGNKYRVGQDVPQDNVRAAELFLLSAQQGNKLAARNLGHMYYWGIGVRRSIDESRRWYKIADENSGAQGLSTNDSVYWGDHVSYHRLNASRGHSDGQYNLAYRYQEGWGVKRDFSQAIKWYTLSSDQGNSWAQNNLGILYYYGRGVGKDTDEAERLYRLSAKQCNPYANYNLGQRFLANQQFGQAFLQFSLAYSLSALRDSSLKEDSERIMKEVARHVSQKRLDRVKKEIKKYLESVCQAKQGVLDKNFVK